MSNSSAKNVFRKAVLRGRNWFFADPESRLRPAPGDLGRKPFQTYLMTHVTLSYKEHILTVE